MYEVLHALPRRSIEASDVLAAAGPGADGEYFVVSAHREENIDSTGSFAQAGRGPERGRRDATACR